MERLREAFQLYKDHGHNGYIGEEVSQLEHARQAAIKAIERYDLQLRTGTITPREFSELVLGAFFHDIGHLVRYIEPDDLELMGVDGSLGVMNHEKVGADYLRVLGFTKRVCDMAGGHVKAKRYLVTVDDDYRNNLSESSKQTLEIQGGTMSNEEKTYFESDPDFDYFLDLREFDESAKNSDPTFIESMKSWYPMSYFETFLVV